MWLKSHAQQTTLSMPDTRNGLSLELGLGCTLDLLFLLRQR